MVASRQTNGLGDFEFATAAGIVTVIENVRNVREADESVYANGDGNEGENGRRSREALICLCRTLCKNSMSNLKFL